jgi:hypothetical protein
MDAATRAATDAQMEESADAATVAAAEVTRARAVRR